MGTQVLDTIPSTVIRGSRAAAAAPAGSALTAAGQAARRRRQRVVSRTAPRPVQLPLRPRGLRRSDCAVGLAPAPLRASRWMRLATTVTVAVVLAVMAVVVLRPASSVSGTELVTVQSGDTLWSIADRAQPGADPRAVIEEIRQLNGLTGDTLPVGLVLEVPVSG